MSARPGVLLVEDDASLQRFVALALDQLDIELRCCASVDAALKALDEQPARLVLTDLMLPERSGFELIAALRAQTHGAPRLVAFSAGLTKNVRARLDALGVWRCLAKPCTVVELERCVREALGAEEDTSPAVLHHEAPAASDPVMTSFGGNRQLHDAFRASCLQQFPADLHAGARALRGGDMSALRMLAHNLKSVLHTLGQREAGTLAAQLEQRAEAGDTPGAAALWAQLSLQMKAMNH